MWALVENNIPTQIFREPVPFTFNNIQYPKTVFTLWTSQERMAIGIYPFQTDPLPNLSTIRIISSSFEFDGYRVIESWNTVNIPSDELNSLLESRRSTAIIAIDAMAESERLKYITGGAGQAMTYQEKYSQALKVIEQQTGINPYEFPLISVEIGITVVDSGNLDQDMIAVATTVKENYDLWKLIGSAIEKERLQAKKDIRNALTIAEIEEILKSIHWPNT